MSLSNKVVLISGANRGIGAATVRELLKTDVARVYAGARDVASLPHYADPRVVPLSLDVTSESSVAAAAAAAPDVDVLINNAGTMGFGDWLNTPQEVLDLDMNTNFHGTLRVIRAFLPQFLARKSGVIANLVSVVGFAPVPALSAYSASKAALQSLTLALRATLAPEGVTVIGVYPGPVDTDLAKGIPLAKVSPEHAAENIVRGISEGQTYIFPDPMSQQVEQLWAPTGRQLEAALQVA